MSGGGENNRFKGCCCSCCCCDSGKARAGAGEFVNDTDVGATDVECDDEGSGGWYKPAIVAGASRMYR